MEYRLKTGVESFQVVDGEFAYHTFKKSVVYEKIPPNEAMKFEEIQTKPGAAWVAEEAGKLGGRKAGRPGARGQEPETSDQKGGDE